MRCSTRALGSYRRVIYYAAKGYSAIGVDGSAGATDCLRDNACKAGGVGGFPGGRCDEAGRIG
nr:hypothetical protein [Mycobacterium lepromatosis]